MEEGRRELDPIYFNYPEGSRQGFPLEKGQRFVQGPWNVKVPEPFQGGGSSLQGEGR